LACSAKTAGPARHGDRTVAQGHREDDSPLPRMTMKKVYNISGNPTTYALQIAINFLKNTGRHKENDLPVKEITFIKRR
jgi:hypothetical protein